MSVSYVRITYVTGTHSNYILFIGKVLLTTILFFDVSILPFAFCKLRANAVSSGNEIDKYTMNLYN